MDIKNNNEWKEIKTVADIPDPKDWDKFEWRGLYILQSYAIIKPDVIYVQSTGIITASDGTEDYCDITYRPKPMPSDEWIEARLWFYPRYDCWNVAKKTPKDMWRLSEGSTCNREWFLTAKWVLKDIKEGYDE